MSKIATLTFLVGLAIPGLATPSELRLGSPFSDHMILQQQRPIPVWGTATPGAKVTVRIGPYTVSGSANAEGRWEVVAPPLEATPPDGGPIALEVTAQDGEGQEVRVLVEDVLVGEVWLASGQSNMAWPVASVSNAAAEIAQADDAYLRMFTVARSNAVSPQLFCQGAWAVCSTSTVQGFSAVAYFFARELRRELGVPVGVLHSSWGGSPIEPWIALDTLEEIERCRERVTRFKTAVASYTSNPFGFEKERAEAEQRQREATERWLTPLLQTDLGREERWETGKTGSTEWTEITVPMTNAGQLGNWVGCAWFRKQVEIPDAWVGRALRLRLGAVDEMEVVFVNGKEIGGSLDLSQWQRPRQYDVPAEIVRASIVTVVVQVANLLGAIGLFGQPSDYSIEPSTADPGPPLSLKGTWLCARGSALDEKTRPKVSIPAIPGSVWDVSTLYNAMIAPLAPYPVRGALWYQGESNTKDAQTYRELLSALVRCWRRAWHHASDSVREEKDFAFLVVQLANFRARQARPIEPGGWPAVRDAQREILRIPGTGLAVTIDIGDAADIHPRNKQEVGRRLALWALAETYGRRNQVYSGPLYRSMTIAGNEVVLDFVHAGSGLVSRGESLVGFAVAGKDRVFYAAQVRIVGNQLRVWSDHVEHPVAVRYGWANNPIVNLYNREGLPASPFRTDTWDETDVSSSDERVTEPALSAP